MKIVLLKESNMFQLVTDTAGDLSFDYLHKHKIDFLGMTVTMNNREYHTDVEGEIDPQWFLESIQAGANPTTSMVNVGQFLDLFTKYAKAKTPVLYLAFSSGLSGTYDASIQARELVKEEHPDFDCVILDTLNAANGQGLIVNKAVELRDAGKSREEIVEILTDIIPKVRSWFTVDDLNHLQRGGRISKVSAVLGSLASIKPIMDVDPEGRLRVDGKVRGRKKALHKLADEIVANLPNPEEQTIFINYSGRKEGAEDVMNHIKAAVPTVKAFSINPLGPTIVTHTGEGCVAVFAIGKDDRK
jgi:DegV family protein with EDD domain